MLAVSRIYLDNVPSIQASWVTQGLRMGQVALAFGANDMGSTMIEENVVAAAGVRNQCDVPQMVRLIRGCRPHAGAAGHAVPRGAPVLTRRSVARGRVHRRSASAGAPASHSRLEGGSAVVTGRAPSRLSSSWVLGTGPCAASRRHSRRRIGAVAARPTRLTTPPRASTYPEIQP